MENQFDFLSNLDKLTSWSKSNTENISKTNQFGYSGIDITNPFGQAATYVLPHFIKSMFTMPSVSVLDNAIHNASVRNVLNSTFGKNIIANAYNLWNQNVYNRFAQGIGLLGNLGKINLDIGQTFHQSKSTSNSYNPYGYLNFLKTLWLGV